MHGAVHPSKYRDREACDAGRERNRHGNRNATNESERWIRAWIVGKRTWERAIALWDPNHRPLLQLHTARRRVLLFALDRGEAGSRGDQAHELVSGGCGGVCRGTGGTRRVCDLPGAGEVNNYQSGWQDADPADCASRRSIGAAFDGERCTARIDGGNAATVPTGVRGARGFSEVPEDARGCLSACCPRSEPRLSVGVQLDPVDRLEPLRDGEIGAAPGAVGR